MRDIDHRVFCGLTWIENPDGDTQVRHNCLKTVIDGIPHAGKHECKCGHTMEPSA